jgi:hypothetical protein
VKPDQEEIVGDLIFIAMVIAFFALAAGFVKLCDRIIGADPAPADEPPDARTDLVDETAG